MATRCVHLTKYDTRHCWQRSKRSRCRMQTRRDVTSLVPNGTHAYLSADTCRREPISHIGLSQKTVPSIDRTICGCAKPSARPAKRDHQHAHASSRENRLLHENQRPHPGPLLVLVHDLASASAKNQRMFDHLPPLLHRLVEDCIDLLHTRRIV